MLFPAAAVIAVVLPAGLRRTVGGTNGRCLSESLADRLQGPSRSVIWSCGATAGFRGKRLAFVTLDRGDLKDTPHGRWTGVDDRDLLVLGCHDRDAFAELYRRHVGGVLAYFSRALDRSDLAFDLTAETFAAALLALPTYKPGPAPGRSWLYAIAHNRLVDSVRKGRAEAQARDELAMQSIVLTEAGEAAIDRIIARIDGRSAFELVRELPNDQRDAIMARFVNGLDYAEIATEMNCSEQVIRKRVSRGLASLGVRLARRSDGQR